MNYHNIAHDDMLNGDGLRVVLWVSGCSHYCENCQNPQTWNPTNGIEFDINAKEEIFEQLSKDYIDGLTLSGGDPLYEDNLDEIIELIIEIRLKFPNKTIWLYTGYDFEEILNEFNKEKCDILTVKRAYILLSCNVVVDGEFIEELADVNYPWAGSTNQRVISVPQTLKKWNCGENKLEIVLWQK